MAKRLAKILNKNYLHGLIDQNYAIASGLDKMSCFGMVY
jgi:hypothetical protein